MRKNIKKILVANNHLSNVGGSELYTYDLIKALKSVNDTVIEYFTFEKGIISDKIEKELQVSFMKEKKYDLILASHNSSVKELYAKAPIIQICHGTVPELEQPSPLADFHIAISEEISQVLNEQGYPNEIILNGIDIKEKKPISSPNPELESVLSLCQDDYANKILEEICQEKDIIFTAHNKHINPSINIAKTINNHDLIIGIGRSIYDAMACGRPCLIYDNRNYNGSKADGYLRPEKFHEYVQKNCSGRYLNRRYGKKELIREMAKYNSEDGKRLRELAKQELNAYTMASRLITATDQLNWQNRLKKWKRISNNLKLFKRAILYKKIYRLTKNDYFNK